jgi:hypothetical protein
MSEDLNEINNDANILMDPLWRAKINLYATVIRTAGDMLRRIVPPERFRSSHTELVEASLYYDLSMKFLEEGIEEIDAAKIRLATENLQLGNEAFARATEKLN